MLTGTCLCGAVGVTIDAKPEFINDCNCSLCRKVGGAWGYFASAAVTVSGATVGFSRRDKQPPGIAVHACAVCGATTHWVLTEAFLDRHPGADRMGVNMRLFDPDELKGIEVRFPDGKAWDGAGPFGHRRPAMTISDATPW